MPFAGKRPFLINLFNISLITVSILLLFEFILSALVFRLRPQEFFLVRFGWLNSTVFAYLFITLSAIGAIVALAVCVLRKILSKLSLRLRDEAYLFSAVLCIILMIIGLRVHLHYAFSELKWYFVPLFIPAAGFFSLKKYAQPHCLKSTQRFKSKMLMNHGRASFLLILLIIMSFLLPFLCDGCLKFRYQKRTQSPHLPNIILIVLDTVRTDVLSCYQNELNLTPNVDKIAREGILFSRAISPSPWTLPTHASIFTGLYPSQHGAGWEYSRLDEEFITLAEHLSQRGYRTAGFSENPIVSREMGLAQGFEIFQQIHDDLHRLSQQAITPRMIKKIRQRLFNIKDVGQYAQDTIRFFRRWIYAKNYEADSKPLFAFLNLMAAHLPNYLRPEFPFCQPSRNDLQKIEPVNWTPERFYLQQYRLDERELGIMRCLYEGEIAYLDSQLGILFDFLEDAKILDQTILILVSDHGENFGDHHLIEHQFCLYNSLLHVPLMIRYPARIKPGSRSDELVSTVFLFKTLLDLIGIQKTGDLEPIENRSLFDNNEDDGDKTIYAEYENPIEMMRNVIADEAPADFDYSPFNRNLKCIYAGDMKWIWASDGQNEVYDTKADWEETRNSILEDESSASLLQKKMKDFQKGLWMPSHQRKTKKMDERELERLKSLGYLK